MASQFVLPVGYVETPSALAYWGNSRDTFIKNDSMNSRLASLVVAICDFAFATQPFPVPRIVDQAHAVCHILPETFSNILRMFRIEEPNWGSRKEVLTYGNALFDDLFAAYYEAFGLAIKWSTRPGSKDVRCYPLIRRREVHRWLRIYIASCPDDFWERLNVVLQKFPGLIDPMTDEPFEKRIIPRSCFPEAPVQERLDYLVKAVESFKEKSGKVLDRIEEYRLPPRQQQQSQSLAAAQADYRAAVEESNLQKELALNAMGGWRIDESGNRTYIEGSQW